MTHVDLSMKWLPENNHCWWNHINKKYLRHQKVKVSQLLGTELHPQTYLRYVGKVVVKSLNWIFELYDIFTHPHFRCPFCTFAQALCCESLHRWLIIGSTLQCGTLLYLARHFNWLNELQLIYLCSSSCLLNHPIYMLIIPTKYHIEGCTTERHGWVVISPAVTGYWI